ncbi:DUF2188 domain-containing protein [Serratia marcescens]
MQCPEYLFRRCSIAGKNQHVVKREDGWAVRGENNTRDTSHHRTQQEAF